MVRSWCECFPDLFNLLKRLERIDDDCCWHDISTSWETVSQFSLVFVVPTICHGYTDWGDADESSSPGPGDQAVGVGFSSWPDTTRTCSSSSSSGGKYRVTAREQDYYRVRNERWENKIWNQSKLLSNLHSKYKILPSLFTQPYHYLLVSIWYQHTYDIMHVPVGWQSFKKVIMFLVVRNS